jgi:hypothetical protein
MEGARHGFRELSVQLWEFWRVWKEAGHFPGSCELLLLVQFLGKSGERMKHTNRCLLNQLYDFARANSQPAIALCNAMNGPWYNVNSVIVWVAL